VTELPEDEGHAIRSLARLMREVGAGKATVGDITLDLTEAPLPAPAAVRETAKTMTDEDVRKRDESILFGAGAGQKVRLR
jgi:hypothetical protein